MCLYRLDGSSLASCFNVVTSLMVSGRVSGVLGLMPQLLAA